MVTLSCLAEEEFVGTAEARDESTETTAEEGEGPEAAKIQGEAADGVDEVAGAAGKKGEATGADIYMEREKYMERGCAHTFSCKF